MANVTMGLDELLTLREEKADLQNRIKDLNDNIASLNKDIKDLKDEKQELKKDYDKRLTELSDGTRVIIKKYHKVLPNITDIIFKVQASLQSDAYVSSMEIARRIADDITAATTEEEISSSVVNFDDVKDQVEKTFKEEVEKEKDTLKQKNKILDDRIASIRADLEKLYEDKSASLIASYKKEIEETREKALKAEKERDELSEKYYKLQDKFNELSAMKEVQIAKLTQTIEEAEEKLHKLKIKKNWWNL